MSAGYRFSTVVASRCPSRAAVITPSRSSAGGVMPISSPLDSSVPRRPTVIGQSRRRPSNKGRHFPADPPRTEEIIAVMRCSEEDEHSARARVLIVILWRAGLRIQEALDLNELDLD